MAFSMVLEQFTHVIPSILNSKIKLVAPLTATGGPASIDVSDYSDSTLAEGGALSYTLYFAGEGCIIFTNLC